MDSTSGFAGRYGRAPDVAWSAPGRVNLIGEHTDYNEGFVLPFALTMRTAVAAGRRDDDTIVVTSTSYAASVGIRGVGRAGHGRAAGWPAYPLGVAWAIGQARPLPPVPGVDLFIDSEVPAGGGLSSSAALEMAVAGALTDLWDLDLTVPELARVGQRAENEFVGAPTGIMDQYARVEATVAALEAGDMGAVGRNLTASHYSMRDDYEITTPALDLAVDVGLAAGALGARMTGGGFGGSTITLIDADLVPGLTAAVQEAFAGARFTAPRVSTVTPGPGARKEA